MNDRRALSLVFPLLMCVVVVAVLLIVAGRPSHALASVRYVAATGNDYGDCKLAADPCGTVQYAVDVADSGDVIKIAAGVYDGVNGYGGLSQVVYLSKTLTIQGGYGRAFSEPPDPEAYHTELDAQGQGRVIFAIGSGVSLTLDGLRLTGGDAHGLAPSSAGGGLCAEKVESALLRNSRVYSNTADIGGGVYAHSSHSSLLDATRIYSNTAREGGGVYFHNTGNPTLTDSEVYGNRSGWNGAGVYVGSGYYETALAGNVLHHNVADRGGGAGAYVKGTNAPWIFNNTVYSNTAGAQGSGLHLDDTRDAKVISNTIGYNTAATNGGGVYISGADRCVVAENEILSNTTDLTGGGIFIYDSHGAILEDNQVHHNAASLPGGGVYVASCENVSLSGNIIHSNTSGGGGGVHCSNVNGATIAGNEVYDNTGANGGGISLYGGGDLDLVNNIVWGNQATVRGAGILANNTSARFVHSTIGRNHGASGDGIGLYGGATLAVTNTILVSNTIGIWVPAGCTATLEATLWGAGDWANTTDWLADGMLLTGIRNYWADPAFVDPDLGDYHIGLGSAAIDRGVNAGVAEDIDGDVREWCYPDLGADEAPGGRACHRLYLPLLMRNAP